MKHLILLALSIIILGSSCGDKTDMATTQVPLMEFEIASGGGITGIYISYKFDKDGQISKQDHDGPYVPYATITDQEIIRSINKE